MISKIELGVKNAVKQLFKENDTIISYRNSGIPEITTPFIIRNKNDIDYLSIDNFCTNNLSVYLSKFQQSEIGALINNGRLIITAKPCDAKGVLQMISDEQIDKDKLVLIVYECDGVIDTKKLKREVGEIRQISVSNEEVNYTKLSGEEDKISIHKVLRDKCLEGSCDIPYFYDYYFVGDEKRVRERIKNIKKPHKLPIQDLKGKAELKKIIDEELSKCIRCNACRNICPACFCSERCIFDKPKLPVGFIDKDVNLNENLIYHLVRFYHVFPNCTGCEECERVCPQGIKLSLIYKYINEVLYKEFGFSAGSTDSARQPLLSYRLGEDLV